jgi:hypothetical protein
MKLLKSLFNLLHFNRKNWKAVSFCVLAATIFWFFNALNKTYTTTISFPLRFDYDNRFYLPVKPLQDELRINVTGMGWDIFRRTIGLRDQPLIIPLERPVTVKKIVGSTLPALFSTQLEAFQVNFVANDTVYIDIQPKTTRWLHLSSDSIGNSIDRNYGIIGVIRLNPDSVQLEGPVEMVSSIPDPYPVNLQSDNIDQDFSEDIDLKIPHEDFISVTPAQVRISFQVERFVEITDTVKLEISNIPKDAQPKMDVVKLLTTLRVREDRATNFPWDSVKAVVDLKSFSKGQIRVRPNVLGLPRYTEVIKVDSIRITY